MLDGADLDNRYPDMVLNYPRVPGAYDEMLDPGGTPRAHWEHVARALGRMGPNELQLRQRDIQRRLRETGAQSGNGPQTEARGSWMLDPVPALLTSGEWNEIELGLSQRAELLSLILKDLYGPRKLIEKGHLPPEAVLGHPGFLFPCAMTPSKSSNRLQFYAADLIRGPDGVLRVLNDVAQSPAGAGYVLKNRITLSRVFPSLFRDSHAHRLARFFRAVRTMLTGLGKNHSDTPRVVMLTPGPEHEPFYEQAYLANYLGIPLVQGGDLTARDRKVYLKTLEGLQPVDVIFRHVNDYECDPLNLNPNSQLGVPGLLHAARLGRLEIANPLGCGFLESPALLAFLPALCRYFLGEDLRLPSVATWWCGQEIERSHVLANLDRLVIKPVDERLPVPTVFGWALSGREKEELIAKIKARPHWYSGQETVRGSTTPVFANGRFEPRTLLLRGFSVAHNGEYMVMPGALARVALAGGQSFVPKHAGGLCKDTWLLATEPEEETRLDDPATVTTHPAPRLRGIPSRVAENLFWFGRYAERTESTARLMRDIVIRLLDQEYPGGVDYMPHLLKAAANQSGLDLDVPEVSAPENELLKLVFDPSRVGGLPYNIQALAKTARSARDRLSDDAHRFLSSLTLPENPTQDLANALEILEHTIFAMSALSGLISESMSRGQGFGFLDIGRRVERGLSTLSILQSTFVTDKVISVQLCEAILSITDSIMTFRRRYRGGAGVIAVLDLLLYDENNPRSVGYQLASLAKSVTGLPGAGDSRTRHSGEERIAMSALTLLRTTDVDPEPLQQQEFPATLHKLTTELQTHLYRLSDSIGDHYFNLLEKPHQLAGVP